MRESAPREVSSVPRRQPDLLLLPVMLPVTSEGNACNKIDRYSMP